MRPDVQRWTSIFGRWPRPVQIDVAESSPPDTTVLPVSPHRHHDTTGGGLQRRAVLQAALAAPAAGAAAAVFTPPAGAAAAGPGAFDPDVPRFTLAVLPDTQYLFDADSAGRPFVIGATSFDLAYGQGFYGSIGDVRITTRALRPADFLTRA